MVGFVLIVVLIAVIALVFLGISLRRPIDSAYRESQEISNFLQSLRQYTTDCKIRTTEFATIEDLAKMCHQGKKCTGEDDRYACDVLQEDLSNVLENSFPISEQGAKKAYELHAYYENKEFEIMQIQQGNCTQTRKKGAESLGVVIFRLEICYSTD